MAYSGSNHRQPSRTGGQASHKGRALAPGGTDPSSSYFLSFVGGADSQFGESASNLSYADFAVEADNTHIMPPHPEWARDAAHQEFNSHDSTLQYSDGSGQNLVDDDTTHQEGAPTPYSYAHSPTSHSNDWPARSQISVGVLNATQYSDWDYSQSGYGGGNSQQSESWATPSTQAFEESPALNTPGLAWEEPFSPSSLSQTSTPLVESLCSPGSVSPLAEDGGPNFLARAINSQPYPSTTRNRIHRNVPIVTLSCPNQFIRNHQVVGSLHAQNDGLFQLSEGAQANADLDPQAFSPEYRRHMNRVTNHTPISSGSAALNNDSLYGLGPSSPSAYFARSYASSEAESSITTYTTYPSTSHLHPNVPNFTSSGRRSSEPSPGPESPSSATMNRTPSARSISTQDSRHGSRMPRNLQPLARRDSTTRPSRPRSSGSGSVTPRNARGKRSKPLDEYSRVTANKTRVDRSVCISCKICKVKCIKSTESEVCKECQKNNVNRPFVCVPAYFIDLVEEACTTLLSQNTIYYTTSEGLERHVIPIPPDIDIAQLLSTLDHFRGTFHIQGYQRGNILHRFDLDACHEYIRTTCRPGPEQFSDFIDKITLLKHDKWKGCVLNGVEQHLSKEEFGEAHLAWESMPCDTTYALIHQEDASQITLLDAANEHHQGIIIASLQLARIFGRKLELAFYDQLQQALVKRNTTKEVIREVSLAALSLRKRVSWLSYYYPTGSSFPDLDDVNDPAIFGVEDVVNVDPVAGYIERVKELCKILYFYACFTKRLHSQEGDRRELSSILVEYPEGFQAVEEKLPHIESKGGFESWMADGVQCLEIAAGRIQQQQQQQQHGYVSYR